MADNNHDSVTRRPPSQGRYSPVIVTAPPNNHHSSNTLSPLIPRSPSLRPMGASPPLSPRIPVHGSHNRSPSFSSTINVVDLLASQTTNGSKPAARNWTKIPLSELVRGQKLVFVDGDTPVEEACQMLVDQNLTSLLLRQSPTDTSVSRTFDYSDLTAFLLMVLGVMDPSHSATMSSTSFQDLVKKAREGDHNIPVKLVGDIGMKDPFMALPASHTLAQVVQIMASGVHRIAVTKDDSKSDVIGILSQRKLVKFFWENVRTFVDLEPLYQKSIGELGIGSSNVISINADARVIDALEIMTSRGISSIAVVDSQKMLVGNISMVDVQHVTRSSSAHLLRSTCAHFLSVIKFEQGLRDGQDQVPVFAVYPTTTLAGTVAKLVATRAHRMWIVGHDIVPGTVTPPTSSTSNTASSTPSTPHLPTSTPHIAISPASTPLVATPPSLMMGKLQGVVSLTDILNLFARVEGLKPASPNEARMNRRRSSTSSIITSISATTERRR